MTLNREPSASAAASASSRTSADASSRLPKQHVTVRTCTRTRAPLRRAIRIEAAHCMGSESASSTSHANLLEWAQRPLHSPAVAQSHCSPTGSETGSVVLPAFRNPQVRTDCHRPQGLGFAFCRFSQQVPLVTHSRKERQSRVLSHALSHSSTELNSIDPRRPSSSSSTPST